MGRGEDLYSIEIILSQTQLSIINKTIYTVWIEHKIFDELAGKGYHKW